MSTTSDSGADAKIAALVAERDEALAGLAQAHTRAESAEMAAHAAGASIAALVAAARELLEIFADGWDAADIDSFTFNPLRTALSGLTSAATAHDERVRQEARAEAEGRRAWADERRLRAERDAIATRKVLRAVAEDAASEGAQAAKAVVIKNGGEWPTDPCESCDGEGSFEGGDDCEDCEGQGYEFAPASPMTDALDFDAIIAQQLRGLDATDLDTARAEARAAAVEAMRARATSERITADRCAQERPAYASAARHASNVLLDVASCLDALAPRPAAEPARVDRGVGTSQALALAKSVSRTVDEHIARYGDDSAAEPAPTSASVVERIVEALRVRSNEHERMGMRQSVASLRDMADAIEREHGKAVR